MHLRRTFIMALVCLLVSIASIAQTNFTFRGNLTYTQELSDIWGYASGGKEYAIVGVFNGVSIVDVTNPDSPSELHFISGPNSVWRDMKVWGDYAYVTNESSGGLLIIDLSGLPGSINTTSYTGGTLGLSSAHNIFIDENGFAYVVGANVGIGGALILDLNSNPAAPVHVGTYTGGYIHDCFVRGDTMWSAEISNGYFAVVDVSNKANPVQLATQNTPSNFTHNVWLSDDGKTLLTTDEVSSAFVGAYDVSNLNNITQLDGFQSNPGSNVIPHNVFIRNDFAIISYYRDGVVLFDLTQPDNLVQVGEYDTSPLSGSGFNGCWGVYPYLPSGNVLASDIENGLFVLTPTYVKACYLRGNVTDFNTTSPLNDVSISISNTSVTASTDFTGAYKTGIPTAGLYDITFAKAGYVAQQFTGVNLQNGIETNLNVQLVPAATFTLIGKVEDAQSGQGIPNAEVIVGNALATYTASTNAIGEFAIGGFPSDLYTIFAGKWGYVTEEVALSLSPANNNFVIQLDKGYYDDFALDFNWSVSSTASTGLWTKGDPIGTDYLGSPANPGADVTNDFGDECFMTGNGGGSGGTDDVDNGITTLTSPVFDLSAYNDPYLFYDWWFFNGGGSGPEDDTLMVRLSNGSSTVLVQAVDLSTGILSQWTTNSLRVSDYLAPTATMTIEFEVSDLTGLGHIVEAAVDRFFAVDSGATQACSTPDPISTTILSYDDVTINWTAVPGAERYEVRGKALGATSFVELDVNNGTANSLTVQNLPTNTTFIWQIQAVCSEIDSIYSGYTAFDTFTVECKPPLNASTINITSTSARITWDPVLGAQQYNIIGGVQGSSSFVSINVTGSTTFFDASGLTPGTTYEWAVRTACNVGSNIYSPFSPTQAFTTSANKGLANGIPGGILGQGQLIRIYPNPTEGILNIKTGMEEITVTIFDASGKEVEPASVFASNAQIDVRNFSPGLYIVRISGEEQTIVERVIFK